MILYIQPIFIPDERRFIQNKLSIESFGKYIKQYPYDVKCIFGGWTYNNEWLDKIKQVITDNIPSNNILDVVSFDKNYGKAYIVNNLFKKVEKISFKYFLTADSDIIFDTSIKNLFERLHDVGDKSAVVRNKPFGYISLEQTGECAHIKATVSQNKYTINNRYGKDETLVYPTKPSGIAGGCLFISKQAWKKVGGYKIMGVYAGDDAYFLLDINRVGFSYQMSPDISIIHPFQNDKEWHKWKVNTLRNGSSNGINRNMRDLLKSIESYDKYWDEKSN